MAQKKFNRVTKLYCFDEQLKSMASVWRWECNFCCGEEPALDAWRHKCRDLCECGHATHQPKKCRGKTYRRWVDGCHCNIPALTYEI
jgi:hypothetical protein